MADKPPSFLISVRFLVALIAFLGYAVQYIQRIDMSVAIVCMVNNTALKARAASALAAVDSLTTVATTTLGPLFTDAIDASANDSLVTDLAADEFVKGDICLFKELTKGKSFDGQFEWNKQVQGLILSAYFYGYITTQILGGVMSIKFGAKIVLALAILVGSILTIAIPFAARISYIALIACRFFTGVAHGSFWPAMSTLWAHWAPPTERSRLAGIANAGAQIGNVVALPLGGFLCVYGFDGGWPSIFYIFGLVGIVWFALWMALTSRSPSDHRFISQVEKQYIMDNTKEAVANAGKIPMEVIGKIFTSAPWWALVMAHSASNFGTYLFLTQLPTYMREILKFDIKSNGGLSALPYIVFWLLTIVSSIVGDSLIQSKKLSKTTVRKIFNTIGLVLPAVAVIGLAFVTCAVPYVGVALLTFGLATTGCAYGAGFMVNYNDIAGSYAGLSFGLANTFGTVPGFVAPYMVGLLTPKQLQSEWQIVFFIAAGIYLAGALGYLILGSGELQPWAAKKAAPRDPEEEIPLNEK